MSDRRCTRSTGTPARRRPHRRRATGRTWTRCSSRSSTRARLRPAPDRRRRRRRSGCNGALRAAARLRQARLRPTPRCWPAPRSATSSGTTLRARPGAGLRATASTGVSRFRGQPLRPARLVRRGLPGHPARDQAARRARHARRRWPASPHLPRGLVLVTGPTGSGKTTTLAALLDLANRTRSGAHHHHRGPDRVPAPAQALPGQPARGRRGHRRRSRTALKHALRQDPDIILVGELRDLETTATALTAAETGHLVLATLHTQSATQTIDRVIDIFPPHQQQQIRAQLADGAAGRGHPGAGARAPTARAGPWSREIMIATPAIRNLIREGKVAPDPVVHAVRRRRRDARRSTSTWPSGSASRSSRPSRRLELCHSPEEFKRLAGRM